MNDVIRIAVSRFLVRTSVVGLVLVLACACAAQPPVELTILHVNDLHARLLPDAEGRGGFAYVAAVLERERAAAAATLTLHAGDMVQGSPVSTLFHGAPIFTIANGLGIDVHCLGNHELDYGWQEVPEYVSLATFDTVSANVTDADGGRLVDPFVVRQVGGLRIAVVGAMTERLSSLVVSAKRGPWNAAPLVPTLRPVVEEAAAVSDMVIVLGHLEGGEAEAILKELPQVAVVVQGHPHVAWEDALEIDGRVAVNASGYGRDVGRLRLRYDPTRRRILSYDWELLPVIAAELTPDPEVERVVAEWEARASAVVDVPIGRATRKIDGDEMLALVKTAMRDAVGAELAYLGEGGIRDDLPQGELLARHVWNVLPFDDELVTVEMSGRQVVELQDRVLEDTPIADPATLDPDRTYRLVSTGYYAARWADSGVELDWTSTGIVLRDAVIDWIKARGSVPVTGG